MAKHRRRIKWIHVTIGKWFSFFIVLKSELFNCICLQTLFHNVIKIIVYSLCRRYKYFLLKWIYIKVIYETLNNKLRKVSAWLQGNKSILNTKKTHVILFKTRNKKTREALKIKISDTEIEQVNWTKFLGIKIDSNLTWKQYITYINQKISKISRIFCKARHYISLKILQILYFALVYPNLHNGNRIWATAYQSTLEPLRKIQRKIIRIITFSGHRDHIVPLFKKLGILPLDEIYKEKTSLFMFRHSSSDIQ